jgi:hypothetical protein
VNQELVLENLTPILGGKRLSDVHERLNRCARLVQKESGGPAKVRGEPLERWTPSSLKTTIEGGGCGMLRNLMAVRVRCLSHNKPSALKIEGLSTLPDS